MTTLLPFAVSPRTISVLLDNRWRSVDVSHPNYKALYDALRARDKDLDLIRKLIDIPSFIAKATFGRVQVGGESVRFDGKDISGVYVQRLLELLRDGFDIEPLARYLEKREQNPVFTAREELDLFFANANTAIAPDGDVYVFKKVQNDYTSYHKGYDGKVFTHTVGSVVEIDESEVNLDRNQTCASGLHFCSYHYLPHYYGGEGRVVILKLNPADVRAIPNDYDNAKGRAVRYLVVGEVPEDEASKFFDGTPVYTPPGFFTEEEEDSENDTSSDDGFESDDSFFSDDEDDSDDSVDRPWGLPDAFDLYQVQRVLDETLDILDRAEALADAFLWDTTAEGFNFWEDAKDTLRDDRYLTSDAKAALEVYVARAKGEPVKEADETQPVDEKVFKTRDGRLFTASEVRQLVKEHGQRGFSRVTGVPRTTVQEWLKLL